MSLMQCTECGDYVDTDFEEIDDDGVCEKCWNRKQERMSHE
jgi:rubredoxin